MRVEFTINATCRRVAYCKTCGDPVIYEGKLLRVWVMSTYPRCHYCLNRIAHGASS